MALVTASGNAPLATAACNLIPQTAKTFDSVVGSTNRPFAAPGEPVDVHVRACDAASNGLGANATDHIVTVVFTPAAGAKHAVVLTAASDCSLINPLLGACATQLGTDGAATCVAGAAAAMQLIDDSGDRRLRFNFPSAAVCNGGSNNQEFCTGDADCGGGGTCETDSAHTRTLSGSATIAVSPAGALALPCDLATTPCAARTSGHCSVTTGTSCTPSTQALACPSGETCKLDLLACVDDFFANDGTCATRTAQGTFNHFTALPVPNDFSADCFANPSVCNASATEFRATTDRDGNVLMPMNWQGILVPSSIPVPRLLRAAFAPAAPLHLPGPSFMASLTPEGGPLAPIFVPQFDPGAPPEVLNLFGSADAPYTILRLARRSQTFQVCSGGYNDTGPCNGADDCPGACSTGSTPGARCTSDTDCAGGGTCGPPGQCEAARCHLGPKNNQLCNSDANCPGGECGASLFNIGTSGTAGGVGPYVVARGGPPGVCQDSVQTCTSTCEPASCSMSTPCSTGLCVQYALTAEDPVNLQSLATNTRDVFAFATDEGIDAADRNGDGDTTDSVVTLRDRTTGAIQALGAPAGCGTFTPSTPQGRAIVELHQVGQRFPAVATEGDVVAFLESEAGENACDENGDGDLFDPVLRVFKLGPTELTSGARVADSALKINGQNVVVSNGIVYFRHSEPGEAHSAITRASVATDGAQANADVAAAGDGSASVSADGRFVAFSSAASTLLSPSLDMNGVPDTFVRDRCVANGGAVPSCTPTTELVSVGPGNVQGDHGSGAGRLSADGRYVVFGSGADNLLATNDTNGFSGVFLRDRCQSYGMPVALCSPKTERINFTLDEHSPTSDPVPELGNYDRTISDDGRFIVFDSIASAMVPNDTSPQTNIFVRDRCLSNGASVTNCVAHTVRISIADDDGDPDASSGGFSISGDGRFVAFASNANNLVPGDIGGADVFVRDRDFDGNGIFDEPGAGKTLTERISVDPNGGQLNNDAINASISGDGRYVAFQSAATNVAPGATNGFFHIFVRDRLTGRTELMSTDSNGIEGNGHDAAAVISANGRFVAWSAFASNYIAGDGNGTFDTVVHDRVTGMTQVVSVNAMGAVGNGSSGLLTLAPALSSDGRTVAFSSTAINFILGDTNGFTDVYVYSPDPTDGASDLTGDGDRNDVVLEQFDTASSTVRVLCPADDTSVVAGAAAFLRPEGAGVTSNANCTGPTLSGPDLNSDGDANDEVVHVASASGTVQNFGVAATLVSMSGLCTGSSFACVIDADCPGGSTCAPTWVAAAVPSTFPVGEVQVHRVSDAPPPAVPWTATGQVADTLQMSGNLAVFITPEVWQDRHLNGDGDKLDRVLQVYDAVADSVTNVGQSAEEFVIGGTTPSCASGPAIVFRTSEASENRDLNGDGDKLDYVLQAYIPGIGLVNTGQAVTACNLAACDPRFPYRAVGDQLKFLTSESDQGGHDLNNDGNIGLVLQIYDLCTRQVTTTVAVDASASADTANPLADTGTQGNDSSEAPVVVQSGKRCFSGPTVLPVPATCGVDADCPAGATCGAAAIAAAPAVVPHHDSVLLPPRPLNVTIPNGTAEVFKTIRVKVRNADGGKKPERPGHAIRLTASDGTCPVGTVLGLPVFASAPPNAPDNMLVAGGATQTASVTLEIVSANFPVLHNTAAPFRCTINLSASAVVPDNADPNPRNDTASLELNVSNLGDTSSTATHESLIKSVSPLKLSIPGTGTVAKTVRVKVVNADLGETSHDITLSASDGDCPPHTVSVAGTATQPVRGGRSAGRDVTVQLSGSDFNSLSAKSPARCTAVLTATTAVSGNSEPDASNNRTELVIDVKDPADF